METYYYFDVNKFFHIILVIWLFSLGFTFLMTIILMFSTKNIFEKTGKDSKYAYIPFYNLFVLLDIVKMSRFSFICLLMPAINVFYIFLLMYRLSIVFRTSTPFTLGLIFLPFIFLPILNNSKYLIDEKEEKEKDNVIDSMMPLLTEKQYHELNNIVDDTPKVDNVFKAPSYDEPPAPVFKANKVKYREMVLPEEKKEEIKRVEPVVVKDIYQNRFINTKVTEEDDSIEIVEL